MLKSLDQKLNRVLSDPSCNDFIIADAKDADMGYGLAAPGLLGNEAGRYRSLEEYRQTMREIVKQGLVDVMLMSPSTSEILTLEERIFDDSHVTPAVRANDATDIWLGVGTGAYPRQPSLPFHSATIDQLQCGRRSCSLEERKRGPDLGLYSLTFNNDAERDSYALAQYREFRLEAEAKGFRHFLEVFAPNAYGQNPPPETGRYVNDCIVRAMGGVVRNNRPLFLKIPYFGPAAMEALVHYDPQLVVGVLGGSAGTTHDAFHMLADAKKHGARVALFGRKINNAENQLLFLQALRAVADGEMTAEEAVKHYHAELEKEGFPPHRSLEDDLQLTQF